MNDKPKESKKDFNIFILVFLFVLLILSVIPIKVNNLDSYFSLGTLKLLQDNLRPFIVVLITILTTIYLKIYSDLQTRQNDSIENFRKDFFEAYNKLQEDIVKYKRNEEVEEEGSYIKTNLRILMKDKKIVKKSSFFDFYKNYKLWNKTEKDYACDHILDNRKNLLQDCLDEIINKNPNDNGIIFSCACLENVQFRNINFDFQSLYIERVDFFGADFSNSEITFDPYTPIDVNDVRCREDDVCRCEDKNTNFLNLSKEERAKIEEIAKNLSKEEMAKIEKDFLAKNTTSYDVHNCKIEDKNEDEENYIDYSCEKVIAKPLDKNEDEENYIDYRDCGFFNTAIFKNSKIYFDNLSIKRRKINEDFILLMPDLMCIHSLKSIFKFRFYTDWHRFDKKVYSDPQKTAEDAAKVFIKYVKEFTASHNYKDTEDKKVFGELKKTNFIFSFSRTQVFCEKVKEDFANDYNQNNENENSIILECDGFLIK